MRGQRRSWGALTRKAALVWTAALAWTAALLGCAPGLEVELIFDTPDLAERVRSLSVTVIEPYALRPSADRRAAASCEDIGSFRAGRPFDAHQPTELGSLAFAPWVERSAVRVESGERLSFDLPGSILRPENRHGTVLLFIEGHGPTASFDDSELRESSPTPIIEGCLCVHMSERDPEDSDLPDEHRDCRKYSTWSKGPTPAAMRPIVPPSFDLTACGALDPTLPSRQRTQIAPGFCVEPRPCVDRNDLSCYRCEQGQCPERAWTENAPVLVSSDDVEGLITVPRMSDRARGVRPSVAIDACDQDVILRGRMLGRPDAPVVLNGHCVPGASFLESHAGAFVDATLPAGSTLVDLAAMGAGAGPQTIVALSAGAVARVDTLALGANALELVASATMAGAPLGLTTHEDTAFVVTRTDRYLVHRLNLQSDALRVASVTAVDIAQCPVVDEMLPCALAEDSPRVSLSAGDLDGDGDVDLSLAPHGSAFSLLLDGGDCQCISWAQSVVAGLLTPHGLSSGHPDRLGVVVTHGTGLTLRDWDAASGRYRNVPLTTFDSHEHIVNWGDRAVVAVGMTDETGPGLARWSSDDRPTLSSLTLDATTPATEVGTRLAAGDFNGDALPDFAALYPSSEQIRVFVGGPGRPAELTVDLDGEPKFVRLDTRAPCEATGALAAGRLSGNGLSALIVGCGSGDSAKVRVYAPALH